MNKLHNCKRGLATATPQDYNEWWREMSRLGAENFRLTKRDDIMVTALAEIKATNDGESPQPISVIIDWCIEKLGDMDNGT